MRGEQIEQMCEREDQREADRQRRIEECADDIVQRFKIDLTDFDKGLLREILACYIT